MKNEYSIDEFAFTQTGDVNPDLYCESNGNWVEGCMNPSECGYEHSKEYTD